MRNTILGFLLAIVLIVGTAATTVSVMTVKPSLPKNTMVYSSNRTNNIKNAVLSYSAKGYITKSITVMPNNYSGVDFYLLIMEKY